MTDEDSTSPRDNEGGLLVLCIWRDDILQVRIDLIYISRACISLDKSTAGKTLRNGTQMIVLKGSQEHMLSALQCISGIVERRHRLPMCGIAQAPGCSITNDMPEAGGGGASASAAPVVAATDDDGGDPDPEPERPRPRKKPSPSAAQRNGTATAAALLPPPTSDLALWRLPTVLQHVPVSRSGWWAGVKSGRYPAPIKLSPRCSAWKASDIRALINSL